MIDIKSFLNIKVQQDLRSFYCETTIRGIYKTFNDQLVVGESELVSRLEEDQGPQVDLKELEEFWQKKFESFGNQWTRKRQLYRLLYDQFRLFYQSFNQLRLNKVRYLESEDQQKDYQIHEFATTNLSGMYLFGKKIKDIVIRELHLEQKVDNDSKKFLNKFASSRNLIFEHNYSPEKYKGLIFEANLWSTASSDSFLRVNIHTNSENEYYALLDYYHDYYDLEKIVVEIIKKF